MIKAVLYSPLVFVCYCYLVVFSFLYSLSTCISDSLSAQFQELVQMLIESVEATVIFSKNVKHYIEISLKFFRYGMYNKIN